MGEAAEKMLVTMTVSELETMIDRLVKRAMGAANNTGYSTLKQVAAHLSVSQSTVRNYIDDGMPYLKLARGLRFELEAVDAWVRERTKKAGK